MTRTSLGVLTAALLAGPIAAHAQASDPAVPTIEAFDAALVESMKAGKALGAEGRFRKLAAAVDRAFDIPTMTRFAVGSAWSSYSAAEQAALTKAFARLTAANLAHNFDSYDGEVFRVAAPVQTRGLDKLVKTEIVPKTGAPTPLNYRMRQSGESWKVIDVYFGAVSQLTAQRSDFAASAQPGDASALLQRINAQTDKLLK
jgi:phospholipid transport system substrate-binding protein